jgi:hypothetical protein
MFENETMIRTRAVRRDATRPWQVWEIAFVVALGGSIIVTVYIASRRLYLGFDDLVTATLVSDPSLSHMIRAIANGVETNPPLFFILEWLVAHVTGHGDFGLRILSAMSLAMTVPVVYATLRKTVKPEVASLALAFVLGLSRGAYEFAILARYYGWMILLAAIAACLFVQLNLASARRRDYFLVCLHPSVRLFLQRRPAALPLSPGLVAANISVAVVRFHSRCMGQFRHLAASDAAATLGHEGWHLYATFRRRDLF